MKNCKLSNDSYWESYKNEMKKFVYNRKYPNTESIIEHLKSIPTYDRWELFCCFCQKYSFSNEELCRLFKFSWIHSAPDVRAVEILEHIDIPSLMDESELNDLNNIPDEVKVYKAVSLDSMEIDGMGTGS